MGSQQPATGELMTPAEVSAVLRIPTTTLAIWRSTGRVRLAYVKIGHAVRYRPTDVERCPQHRVPPASVHEFV